MLSCECCEISKNTFFYRTSPVAASEKGFLITFAKITGKHICLRFFLIKLQAFSFIKKRLQHKYFPVKFAKFLRIPIFKNICERLLLQWRLFTYLKLDFQVLVQLNMKVKVL